MPASRRCNIGKSRRCAVAAPRLVALLLLAPISTNCSSVASSRTDAAADRNTDVIADVGVGPDASSVSDAGSTDDGEGTDVRIDAATHDPMGCFTEPHESALWGAPDAPTLQQRRFVFDEGVVIDEGACAAYAVDPFRNAIVEIDLHNGAFGTELAVIPVGASPWTLARSTDGSKLFVATQERRILKVVDVATHAVTSLALQADATVWSQRADTPISVGAINGLGGDELVVFFWGTDVSYGRVCGATVRASDGVVTGWMESVSDPSPPVGVATAASGTTGVLFASQGEDFIIQAGSSNAVPFDAVAENNARVCVSPNGAVIYMTNEALFDTTGSSIRHGTTFGGVAACEFSSSGRDVWVAESGTPPRIFLIPDALTTLGMSREVDLPMNSSSQLGSLLHVTASENAAIYVTHVIDRATGRVSRAIGTAVLPVR